MYESDVLKKVFDLQKKIDRLKAGNETLRKQNRRYRRVISELKGGNSNGKN